jgi:hypothetical protein
MVLCADADADAVGWCTWISQLSSEEIEKFGNVCTELQQQLYQDGLEWTSHLQLLAYNLNWTHPCCRHDKVLYRLGFLILDGGTECDPTNRVTAEDSPHTGTKLANK